MKNPNIVSKQEWLNARINFLKNEKEFTRLRDQLSAERRVLPWYKIDKKYEFDGDQDRRAWRNCLPAKTS